MSHSRTRRTSYPGAGDPMSTEHVDLNPDDDEANVDEGEIPLDSYDEAVVLEQDREDTEPEHMERESRNPC